MCPGYALGFRLQDFVLITFAISGYWVTFTFGRWEMVLIEETDWTGTYLRVEKDNRAPGMR